MNGPWIAVLEHEDGRGGVAFVLGAYPTVDEAKAACQVESDLAFPQDGREDGTWPLQWEDSRHGIEGAGQWTADADGGAGTWTVAQGGFWVG